VTALRKLVMLLILILAVLLGATFTLLNSDSVSVNLYVARFDVPLSVLIFLSLLVGAVLGAFACVGFMLRHVRDNRRLSRRARLAEDELSRLRKIPIKDSY
jgi:lipopolysaccharide assembly protein A